MKDPLENNKTVYKVERHVQNRRIIDAYTNIKSGATELYLGTAIIDQQIQEFPIEAANIDQAFENMTAAAIAFRNWRNEMANRRIIPAQECHIPKDHGIVLDH